GVVDLCYQRLRQVSAGRSALVVAAEDDSRAGRTSGYRQSDAGAVVHRPNADEQRRSSNLAACDQVTAYDSRPIRKRDAAGASGRRSLGRVEIGGNRQANAGNGLAGIGAAGG